MTKTTNYQLPQWEETDRIMMDDFNDAMAAIDAAMPRIMTGTYTGDGAATRTISLGFTPKCVYVCLPQGTISSGSDRFFGGFAVTGSPAITGYIGDPNPVAVVSGGFQVVYAHPDNARYVMSNNSGQVYHYIAVG